MKPSVMKYKNYTFYYIPGLKTIIPVATETKFNSFSLNPIIGPTWERVEIPGQLHREDGPAYVRKTQYDLFCDWYYLGKRVNAKSQAHFYQLTCKLKDILF